MEKATAQGINDSNTLPNAWEKISNFMEIIIVMSVMFGIILMTYYYIKIFT